ncbi:hypothetical protein LIER_42682 [Lithospermum erythrorhizon]|uniref:Uncharacterized protein n=1 Tax=Lithospermum erythrorhizon TaxID=34254 RepID=A0AAV3NR74_LITER
MVVIVSGEEEGIAVDEEMVVVIGGGGLFIGKGGGGIRDSGGDCDVGLLLGKNRGYLWKIIGEGDYGGGVWGCFIGKNGGRGRGGDGDGGGHVCFSRRKNGDGDVKR